MALGCTDGYKKMKMVDAMSTTVDEILVAIDDLMPDRKYRFRVVSQSGGRDTSKETEFDAMTTSAPLTTGYIVLIVCGVLLVLAIVCVGLYSCFR